MPLYAYTCEACHTEFERRQSFHEDPIEVCPNCGQAAARRMITPVGVIFKGSGFYVTDNRDATNGSTNAQQKQETEKEKESADDTAPADDKG